MLKKRQSTEGIDFIDDQEKQASTNKTYNSVNQPHLNCIRFAQPEDDSDLVTNNPSNIVRKHLGSISNFTSDQQVIIGAMNQYNIVRFIFTCFI